MERNIRKLFRPFQEFMHNKYEKMTFYKAPRGRSRKVRKYADVDLTKEFEFRLNQREARKKKRLQELYSKHDLKALGLSELISLDNKQIDKSQLTDEQITALETAENAQKALIQDLKNERQELVAEFDDDSDLTKKVLISGIKKISVLGVIKYHQIKHSVFEEIHYHPELLKGLETLHYHVEHNIPIEKELVFKLVPELFVHEINKLDWEDRKRFEKPRITFSRADGDILEVDVAKNIAENQQNQLEQLQDKSMRMEMYLYEQTVDLFDLYNDKLKDEVLHGGHIGLTEYMILLQEMDEENMKDWEKRLMSEIRELRLISEDIAALRQHMIETQRVIVIPEWVMDPQLRQEAYTLLTYAEKYETIDINSTFLIPTPIHRGLSFEERLREAVDVDAMVDADNAKLKEYANQRIPLPERDLTKKDDDLITKMNLLAKAVEVDQEPVFGVDIDEDYIIEESLRAGLPTDKRILVDEVFKILYFNNQDPDTFSISFWSDYFNISPATVRNVVNYMAYPIVDDKTKKVIKVLYFQDTELANASKKLLEGLDREKYLGYLEVDYYQRMKEEYQDELGLFGRIDAPKFIDPQLMESTAGGTEIQSKLDAYLSNQVTTYLEDDKILQDIDDEIKKITDSEMNNVSAKKNLKKIE